MNVVTGFFSGAFMATFAVAGLIFFRLYLSSRDKFYAFFSVACTLIALERVILLLYVETTGAVTAARMEQHIWIYSIRLAAFAMILFAIIGKNRRAY